MLIHALRDSLCHALSGSFDCSNFDQFVVWDGDQILGERREGTLFYVHAGGIDHPLEILDSRPGMDGRVPSYDWRGLGQSSRWTDGTPADCSVTSGPCTRIDWPAGAGVYYKRPPPGPGNNGPLPTWVGSLLANGEDGTGLLYRRNRYYDPASGRFTQEDPIGLAGGLNLYGFAAGDPVNFSDPFGLQGCRVAGSGFRAPDGSIKCDDPNIDESAATFFTLYGVFGALRGLARAGIRALARAFLGKEAIADGAAIGRGIGAAVRGQATGKTAAIAEGVTRAGLTQAEAVAATEAAVSAGGLGGSFTQAVGGNVVVSSVRAGSGIPVLVVQAGGSVVRGTADLVVKGTKVIISNVRF